MSSGSGTPTGSVQFKADGNNIGTAKTLSSGSATASIDTLAVTSGTPHAITAVYTPTGNFSGNTGTLSGGQAVNKAGTTTAITSFAPTSGNGVIGQAVTVNWTVAVTAPGGGTPTGTVTVTGGSGCSAALATGHCDVTFPAAGAQTVSASYAGDTHFTGSASGNSSYTVAKAAVTVTIDSIRPTSLTNGSPMTTYVTVTAASPGAGTPTGTVTISDDASGSGQPCTATLTAGKGSCSYNAGTTSTATVTATYNGDANFDTGSSTSPISISAIPTNTTLAASPSSTSTYGTPVTWTATVKHGATPVTTGSVTFILDGGGGTIVALSGTGTAAFPLSATLAAGPRTR